MFVYTFEKKIMFNLKILFIRFPKIYLIYQTWFIICYIEASFLTLFVSFLQGITIFLCYILKSESPIHIKLLLSLKIDNTAEEEYREYSSDSVHSPLRCKFPIYLYIAFEIHVIIYEGGLKSFQRSLFETRDKRLLGRELDRSLCHRHTTSMIKLFWLQPMAPCALGAAYRQGEKFLA